MPPIFCVFSTESMMLSARSSVGLKRRRLPSRPAPADRLGLRIGSSVWNTSVSTYCVSASCAIVV